VARGSARLRARYGTLDFGRSELAGEGLTVVQEQLGAAEAPLAYSTIGPNEQSADFRIRELIGDVLRRRRGG
jgi:hypothetical protein